MIQEIIVVEGRDDTAAIKRAVEADTIETGGSALSKETMQRIELAHKRRGIIIFTDPDYAGERLRKLISQRIPGCKHAFITRSEATNKKDIGVENASPDVIREALQKVWTETRGKEPLIPWEWLIEAGLTAHPDARKRREKMGRYLRIGYANARQFHHRLHMFQISESEWIEAYQLIEQGENNGT